MSVDLRCENCGYHVQHLLRVESPWGSRSLWCEPCTVADRQKPFWERSGVVSEPLTAEEIYRQHLTELRTDLSGWQLLLDTTTREDERERAEKALAEGRTRHDEMLGIFRQHAWQVPNPRWQLRTAAARAQEGRVYIEPWDVEMLQRDLRVQQWTVEPAPGTPVPVLTSAIPQMQEQLRQTMMSLNHKVWKLDTDRAERRHEKVMLNLQPPEMWLLHQLMARHVVELRQYLASRKEAPDEFQADMLRRWAEARDLSRPSAAVFTGLRLSRTQDQERQQRRARAKGLWDQSVISLSRIKVALGDAQPSTADSFVASGGLIWTLTEYMQAATLPPEFQQHLETILTARRQLRTAIQGLELYAASDRPT